MPPLHKPLIHVQPIFMFRPGGSFDGQLALETFLQLSLEKGYKFKTVDTYLTDNDTQS